MPTGTPRVAAHKAPRRQVSARRRAMALERLQSVQRTGGGETAGRAQPGAQEKPVALDQGHEHREYPRPEPPNRGHGRDLAHSAAHRVSSSRRTTRLSASEAALGNCWRSKGARRRSTQASAWCCWAQAVAATPGAWRTTAARAWWRSKDRVTERLASFLGSTKPSRQPGNSVDVEDSSTHTASSKARAVDNSGSKDVEGAAVAANFASVCGKWCSTKWVVRATGRVPRAFWKSAAFRLALRTAV